MKLDERYKVPGQSLHWGAPGRSYARARDLHPSLTWHILSRLQARRVAPPTPHLRGEWTMYRTMILWRFRGQGAHAARARGVQLLT